MSTVTRFDYVRIIFRIDHDAFQSAIIPQIRDVARKCRPHVENATTYKVAPLGHEANGGARFALDCWGEMADYFVLQMPVGWWDLVYRLDLRYSDLLITESAIAGLSAYYSTKEPGAVGINTFNTPGARKTDRRDVGGRGLRIGSRKSDKCIVVYKRRSENGAIEFRAQGKYAKWLAQTALANTTTTRLGDVYAVAFAMMEESMRGFLSSATGKSDYPDLVRWGEAYIKSVRFTETSADAKEELEADAWFQGLPEQEQMDLQAASWLPTAKGLHEPNA